MAIESSPSRRSALYVMLREGFVMRSGIPHLLLLSLVLFGVGSACTYYPTKPGPLDPPLTCGNWELDSPELCDGPELGGKDCTDAPVPGVPNATFYRGQVTCAKNCLQYDTTRCSGFCGDGIIDRDAPIEPEQCDSMSLNGHSCREVVSPGGGPFYAGTLKCQGNCRGFDPSDCRDYCGDGTAQRNEGELCDRNDFRGDSCRQRGFYRGELSCNTTCNSIDPAGCNGRCGDNFTDFVEGEECDGTGTIQKTCRDLGFYHGQPRCTRSCDVDPSNCFGRCGDGTWEPNEGETCDGRQGVTKTCRDMGFYRGRVTCNDSCELDTRQCNGFCGDGLCEDNEGENCASCAADCNCGIFGDCNPAGFCECVMPNTIVNCSNGCNANDRMFANCRTCGGPGCDEVPTSPNKVTWRQFLPTFPDTYSKCGGGQQCITRQGTLFFPDGCEPFFDNQHQTPNGQCISDLEQCTQLFIDDLEARGIWPNGRARFGAGSIHIVQLTQSFCQ